jgi:hypothetical protein
MFGCVCAEGVEDGQPLTGGHKAHSGKARKFGIKSIQVTGYVSLG